jgi:hypothetical protein
VLPLLPTTPFVLVAAACFAKSSPRIHAMLLNSRLFGPALSDWDRNRCISRGVRRVALSMMIVVGGASVLLCVPPGWPRFGGIGLIGLGCFTVLALKVCSPATEDLDRHVDSA